MGLRGHAPGVVAPHVAYRSGDFCLCRVGDLELAGEADGSLPVGQLRAEHFLILPHGSDGGAHPAEVFDPLRAFKGEGGRDRAVLDLFRAVDVPTLAAYRAQGDDPLCRRGHFGGDAPAYGLFRLLGRRGEQDSGYQNR